MALIKLESFLADAWLGGNGGGTTLIDPTTGEEIAEVTAVPCKASGGLAYAREIGGVALRSLTYTERAALLQRVADVTYGESRSEFRCSRLESGN